MFMKNLSIIIAVIALAISGVIFFTRQSVNAEGNKMNNQKTLVVYYSYSGNTEIIAKKIQSQTGADLFKIETVKPYPTGYNEVVEQAKQEKASSYMPELKQKVANLQDYDTVFVGTPIWWYTMAPAVKSFLSENNLSGKTIIPFCTHGGGGCSAAFSDMEKFAPDSKFKKGLVIYEKGNSSTDDEITRWLKSL